MSGSSQQTTPSPRGVRGLPGASAKQSRRRPSLPSPGTRWSRWRCGIGPCSQPAVAAQTRGPFPAPQARHASRPIPHSRKGSMACRPSGHCGQTVSSATTGQQRTDAGSFLQLPGHGAAQQAQRGGHCTVPYGCPCGVFLSTDSPSTITVTRRQHVLGNRTLATNRRPPDTPGITIRYRNDGRAGRPGLAPYRRFAGGSKLRSVISWRPGAPSAWPISGQADGYWPGWGPTGPLQLHRRRRYKLHAGPARSGPALAESVIRTV
jgi:hypothetical protein